MLVGASKKLARITRRSPIVGPFRVDPAHLRYGEPILKQARLQHAVLEIDWVNGVETFPLEFKTMTGTITLKELFAELGLNIEIRWSSEIPLEMMGVDGKFSTPELLDVMNAYREEVDDSLWHFYVIVGGEYDDQPSFITHNTMFDSEYRRGSAIFESAVKESGTPIVWRFMHTLGHQLNLPHPWQAYGDTRSAMTYKHPWPNWSWEDEEVFRFDAFGKAHIQWAPEKFVRPGGSSFLYYGGTTPWETILETVKHGAYKDLM